jgi:adenine deaminase
LDEGLNAFVAAGISADHEGTTAEGAMRRAELGCYVQQRYGSAWLDMPNLVRAVTENPGLDTRFFALVTDDVTPATVVNEGHLDRVVRRAIAQGLSPIQAVQMVTLNAAQLLERSREIGTVSPGRAADLLIVSDLVAMMIDQVYCDGVLVAENGELVVEIAPYEYLGRDVGAPRSADGGGFRRDGGSARSREGPGDEGGAGDGAHRGGHRRDGARGWGAQGRPGAGFDEGGGLLPPCGG